MTSRLDLDAGSFVLSLAVAEDRRLHQVGLGAPGSTPEALPFPIGLYPVAYPTAGEEALREPALRVTHGDGVVGTRLVVSNVEPGEVTTVTLVDRVAPTVVRLRYRPSPEHGVIETWAEVRNEGDAPIVVHRAAAAAVPFAVGDAHLTHWGGGWAAEWTETVERLAPGVKSVSSAGAVRPALTRPPIVLVAPERRASEVDGTVLACALLWGGDVRFDAEVALHDQGRLIAGHRHEGAERHLDPGAAFETPHALLAWSEAGIGPTSRALHAFARDRLVRDGHRIRATVSNTWEAVGMRIDTPTLVEQVDRAADLGAEVFLLDDGWFGGDEFPRDDDDQGLGDWVVDPAKFPDGLQPTIDRTIERGMRFGLWVEPEMVNPRSALYRAHPDWVIEAPGRERREFRQQLVLDLCRSDVRDFVLETIDRILAEHPDITYLKWDNNRDVFEPWSSTLPADRQSHQPVDLVHATWEVMAEVARRHPTVELMLCASGGGRSDLATLRSFHEVWTSDDTDPVDRIRIQWGASHLLPASTMAAHVTRWGQRPMPFGCAVAMAGRFGFDLDLTALTDVEREVCAQAAADYAAIRDVVQQGDLHRLVSPMGSDRAALVHLDGTGERAVVFAWVFPEDHVRGDAAGSAPADGVPLPEVLRGRTWRVVDRTPGRVEGRIPDLDGDVLAWPDGPYGAHVVELIAQPPR